MQPLEKTTIPIKGKGPLECYVLAETKTFRICLVPTDASWEYFEAFRIGKATRKGQEITSLFGVVARQEMNLQIFK